MLCRRRSPYILQNLERKKHIQPRFKEIQDKIQTENNHFKNSDFESRQGER